MMSFVHGAALVLFLEAFEACDAALHRFSRKAVELGLDALRLQFVQYQVQKNSRIAFFARAAVKCDDFHGDPPVIQGNTMQNEHTRYNTKE